MASARSENSLERLMSESMSIAGIERVEKESPSVKTFRFRYDKEVKAGQFFMVWIPKVDEIPMSVSYNGELKGITVAKVGDATEKLHALRQGDKIGIRGPFGNGFELDGNRVLIIAGGTGIASLILAVECLVEKSDVTVILGAKNRDELIFLDRLRRLKVELVVTTDDGSLGVKGFATDMLSELSVRKIDSILTCGPEAMMRKVVDFGVRNGIPVQASLERFMKCGIGLCDSCSIDGFQVCRDGPVFDGNFLYKSEEFGKFRRDESGRRMRI